MATGRALSQSSVPRYMAKMLRRFVAISTTNVNTETVTPSTPNNAVAYTTAYSVTANWVNGFLPYSQLRYKVLAILAKHGVNRSIAYLFMAFVQHAYKQLVRKDVTTVNEVVERFYNTIYGGTDSQRKALNIPTEVMDDILEELLELIGIKANIVSGVINTK